jgi:hypothetical protein
MMAVAQKNRLPQAQPEAADDPARIDLPSQDNIIISPPKQPAESIAFAILRQSSPIKWIGTISGFQVEAELLPVNEQALWNGQKVADSVQRPPELESSSFRVRFSATRTTVFLESFFNREFDLLRWGPTAAGRSLVAIGRPADIPPGALLLAIYRGNVVDKSFLASWAAELTLNDFMGDITLDGQAFDTGILALRARLTAQNTFFESEIARRLAEIGEANRE